MKELFKDVMTLIKHDVVNAVVVCILIPALIVFYHNTVLMQAILVLTLPLLPLVLTNQHRNALNVKTDISKSAIKMIVNMCIKWILTLVFYAIVLGIYLYFSNALDHKVLPTHVAVKTIGTIISDAFGYLFVIFGFIVVVVPYFADSVCMIKTNTFHEITIVDIWTKVPKKVLGVISLFSIFYTFQFYVFVGAIGIFSYLMSAITLRYILLEPPKPVTKKVKIGNYAHEM